MTETTEQVGKLLGDIGAHDTFTARRTAGAEDLHLEVKGYGRVRFPISRTQAQRLCRVARPARYGQGEQTLLDKQVRDTWKIAKSRVKIDKRRWNRTLLPMLDALRAALGLPEGCKLKAELHSMLVYAPGQFFLPHQDSEKADDMIGTLVVTLPSAYKGGVMAVEHQGERVTYRASTKPLTFIAFYADCRHEVRPVKEGYRIVLTYNLMLADDAMAAADAAAEVAPETVEALAELLQAHFETPRPPRWQADAPPREPASRLVYLLDHQYTERGFGWHRLKGNDAARAAALSAAAERRGCESVLALADIHETWGCMEPGWDEPRYGRHRSWARDEDDEWYSDDEPLRVDDPDAYDLQELHDSSIVLKTWVDPSGKEVEPIVTAVDDEEVCATTPSANLEPYASEYEGYMGNWGNTMDRWYRRAAIVVWPRERAFAVRAEASPVWALKMLAQRIRAGELAEAREMAASLLPFWDAAATSEERRGFFNQALRVAAGLDTPELAASFLKPFQVEALTSGRARALAALVKRYGEDWTRPLLAEWSGSRRIGGRDRFPWLASLPRLCKALRKADDAAGTSAAKLLLEEQWGWLEELIDESRDLGPPSIQAKALASLARPLLGFFGSTEVVDADNLRKTALTCLCADDKDRLLPCLMQMLRAAAKKTSTAMRARMGLDAIGRHCARSIEARLELPAREADDWSIVLPEGCSCELCSTLDDFLSDPDVDRLEWPIAKEKRRHVHRRLDAHELPVRHRARRSGSPYTLVLTKTEELHAREAKERRSLEADLTWLAKRGWRGDL